MDLKISLLQSNLKWEDISSNLTAFEQEIATLNTKTDLILLPEMFTTGFSMNPAQLAEQMDGRSMQWMAEKAAEQDAAVVGSLIIEENKAFYNRLIWMFPDGNYEYYDKRHLFMMASEDHFYTAGTQKLIVNYKGWKICPLVCYDLRFPVWSRNLEDYDLLIYIANWPVTRSFHWKSLLTARAIENQSFTIGVNRVGKDVKGHYYTGDSSIISPLGETLFHAADRVVAHTQIISKTDLEAARTKLPFLADRDEFEVKIS